MNKIEFSEIIKPVAEYYGRDLSKNALQLFFNAAQSLSAEQFKYLISKHMQDPDEGRFFPTYAHMIAQLGTRRDIEIQAGIDFDNDSSIDGSSQWVRRTETVQQTEARRRKYIAKQGQLWDQTSPKERIELTQALTHEKIAIEG